MKRAIVRLCIPLFILATLACFAGDSKPAATIPAEAHHPLATPAAVVVAGQARFTILTPQLIRMEWAADSQFEDHASMVFIDR